MTAERSYEDREEEGYQTVLLRHVRASVRSIEDKVEEILDELKDHLEDQRRSTNEWHASWAWTTATSAKEELGGAAGMLEG